MKIEIDATPPYGRALLVGGFDIGPAVRGFDLSFKVGEIGRVSVDLAMLENTTVTGDVEVILPDLTRDALIALGWTPPAA